jgi:hypothetical protein
MHQDEIMTDSAAKYFVVVYLLISRRNTNLCIVMSSVLIISNLFGQRSYCIEKKLNPGDHAIVGNSSMVIMVRVKLKWG